MRYYLIIYTRYVAQVVCINLAILKSLDFVEIKLKKKKYHTVQNMADNLGEEFGAAFVFLQAR